MIIQRSTGMFLIEMLIKNLYMIQIATLIGNIFGRSRSPGLFVCYCPVITSRSLTKVLDETLMDSSCKCIEEEIWIMTKWWHIPKWWYIYPDNIILNLKMILIGLNYSNKETDKKIPQKSKVENNVSKSIICNTNYVFQLDCSNSKLLCIV